MDEKTVVEKIVDYIETHLDEELSLDKIAKELNYSKFLKLLNHMPYILLFGVV